MKERLDYGMLDWVWDQAAERPELNCKLYFVVSGENVAFYPEDAMRKEDAHGDVLFDSAGLYDLMAY